MPIILQFSPDSNVDVVVHNADGDERFLGSRPVEGVSIRNLNFGKFVTRIELPMTDCEEEFFYNFILEQIGKPYDNSATNGTKFRDWRSSKQWFGSELMAAALEHCGFFPHSIAAEGIMPNDLWLAISARIPTNVR